MRRNLSMRYSLWRVKKPGKSLASVKRRNKQRKEYVISLHQFALHGEIQPGPFTYVFAGIQREKLAYISLSPLRNGTRQKVSHFSQCAYPTHRAIVLPG